jgi:hypothetical protein
MTGNHDEKFEQVVRLVRDGMEQRFRRDRVVVHVRYPSHRSKSRRRVVHEAVL